MDVILKNVAAAGLAYTTHYVSIKIYSYMCVPDGVFGYFTGFLTTGSPLCSTGVQIITSTQTSYSSMILMGISRSIIDIITPSKGLPAKSLNVE